MARATKLTLADLRPNYHRFATGAGKPVMDAFADLPAVYPAMRAISLAGLPAAFAMIERAETEMRQAHPAMMWNDRLKMFLGICTLRAMALYGHPPKGIKRSIPHPSFSRGEVYEIKEYVPILHTRTATGAASAPTDMEKIDL